MGKWLEKYSQRGREKGDGEKVEIFNKRGECKRTAKNAPCKVLLAYTAIISIPSLKSNTNNSIAFLM